jgi:hypothetical protein
MSVLFEVDSSRNLIRFNVTGYLDVDEVINTVQEAMLQIDRSRPLYDLWDMSAMMALDGEAEDIERLAHRWAAIGPVRRPPGKTALVASTSYQYGVARMYMSWLGDQVHWESRLFKGMPEAMAWLEEE